jgi:tetratricopeptide (TPR) repeat protein
MRKLFLTALLVLSALVMTAQTSIQVQTHNVVAEDERFNVTFVIDGNVKVSEFSWEPGSDFQLLWGPQRGHSSSIQIINGKTTKSVQTTFSYVLRPLKAGRFSLPSARANVDGKELVSSSESIEVVSQQAQSRQQNPSSSSQSQTQQPKATQQRTGEDIILTLNLSRTNVVVGEPITATIMLYTRADIAGFESAQFPDFNGFWSQEQDSPTNIEFSRATYNGQIYNAALLKKYMLIPQQTGALTISPAEIVCLVNVRTAPSGNSIFDGFFDSVTTVRQKVVSKAVKVNVSALPKGAPESFGGGVGEFTISAKMSKDSLKTHEAASLIVTVSGKGNISLIQAPDVKLPPDMEAYDTKTSDRVDKSGYSGSKRYEYPFIPRSWGDFVIPPVKYSYYDVKAGKYVTLQTDSIAFNVARGADVPGAGTVISAPSQKDVKSLGTDIRYINVKNSQLSAKGVFFVGSALFWVLSILIVLLAVVCWAAFRKIAARRADVAGAKNRKATKMAMKRLRLAGTFLRQNLYTAFYEELHKALLGFMSDKLNVPVAELSKERIAEILSEGGVPASLIDSFVGLIDACEFARYSPSAGNEAMTAHYEAALDVISSVDSNMKTSKTVSKGKTLMLTLLLMIPIASSAAENYPDSLWNAANEAYAQERWEDAVNDYTAIAEASMESAPLWCNLGSAWYKSGNLGKAILCYERALKLDPSYEDARYNLELLNAMKLDRLESVPELILATWMKNLGRTLDSDSWAVCFLVFLVLTLAMVLLFILGSSATSRRAGFFTGVVCLLLAVASLSFSLWQKNEYMKADKAIIMKPVSSVKSSPSGDSAKDLFVLHEGTKVQVLDNVGGWSNIELSDGRQGWLPSSDIEII